MISTQWKKEILTGKLEDTNYHNISLLATLECIASNPIKASKLARDSNFQVYFHLLVGRRDVFPQFVA